MRIPQPQAVRLTHPTRDSGPFIGASVGLGGDEAVPRNTGFQDGEYFSIILPSRGAAASTFFLAELRSFS